MTRGILFFASHHDRTLALLSGEPPTPRHRGWIASCLIGVVSLLPLSAQTGGRGGIDIGGGVGISPPIALPPGGGINNGGGIGISPPIVLPPGGGIIVTPIVPRIFTAAGFVTGNPAAASVTLTGADPLASNTYRWTISGGRITSLANTSSVEFTADAPGTVNLSVTVISDGNAYVTSTSLQAVAANAAGALTAPSMAAAGALITASVPPAVDNDRTFRWSISGDAGLSAGQGTNSVSIRVGSAGVKELTCAVSFRNIVTLTLRSFLVITGSGTPVPLTVVNGTGTATLPAGSLVDIFAVAPAANQVFDRWTGDVAALGNDPLAARLPHAVVTMPAAPVTLTATYKDAPLWTATVVNGFNAQPPADPAARGLVTTTLRFHIPPNPRGLVFLLHASGGSDADWFTRPDALLIARDLVAAGYGVAALGSVNAANGRWDLRPPLAANPDALNHAAALEKFSREGLLPPRTPVFMIGAGAGGDAAVQIGELLATAASSWPVRGAVLYAAAGTEALALTSHLPQLIMLAPGDASVTPAALNAARRNVQLAVGRGLPAALLMTTMAPLTAENLRLLAATAPNFTASDAQAVWQALKAAGCVDANGYVLSVPAADALKSALPAAYAGRAADIVARLAVAAAREPLASESSARVIDFFERRSVAAVKDTPSRLVNLSTRGKVAFVGDSFTLGFVLSGPEPATVLIRAVGPTLERFGVRESLALPRLEINRGAAVIAVNEDWNDPANNAAALARAASSVGAFALSSGAPDCAVMLTLPPGNYTATIRGINGTIGDVLAEIYDLSRNATRISSLATLARINAVGDLVIPGFVVEGTGPRTLLVRATAPGLAEVGLPPETLLANPRLTVLGPNNAFIASNDNWTQGDAAALGAVFASCGAFPLRAANGDSALTGVFNPGAYTVQAASVSTPPGLAGFLAGTGTLLVEIFEVP